MRASDIPCHLPVFATLLTPHRTRWDAHDPVEVTGGRAILRRGAYRLRVLTSEVRRAVLQHRSHDLLRSRRRAYSKPSSAQHGTQLSHESFAWVMQRWLRWIAHVARADAARATRYQCNLPMTFGWTVHPVHTRAQTWRAKDFLLRNDKPRVTRPAAADEPCRGRVRSCEAGDMAA